MKYLVISKWKPEANPELRKRMREWQPEEDANYLLEPHRVIGRCMSCFIIDGGEEKEDWESMIKGMAKWEDLVEYEILPIYSSKESSKLLK